jgi:hypothetical protein
VALDKLASNMIEHGQPNLEEMVRDVSYYRLVPREKCNAQIAVGITCSPPAFGWQLQGLPPSRLSK